MDLWDFPLTLGYIKLRLREGETLPRAKRIFHITLRSGALIKYGYIRRAKKNRPKWIPSPVYGLSSYLAHRAKAGRLRRFWVDPQAQ